METYDGFPVLLVLFDNCDVILRFIAMSASTLKKVVSSEASLIQCLICAESLENNQRRAVSISQ